METLEQIGIKAKKASRYLAKLGIDEKNKALEAVADALTANAESIIAANEKDLVNAKANGMKPALIDRLTLDVKRINAMADGIRVLTGLEDPVGEVTGTSDKLPVEQQLEMIRAILPDAKKIGIMYTTSEVNSASTLAEYKEKAADYGFEIVESGVSSTADIPLAADSLLEQVDCLNNLTDNTVVASLPLILSKANAKNIPVFGSEIEQVKIGCLAAMGLDYVDLGKQTGRMAAEVLKGEKKASELNFEVIETAAFYGNSKVAEDLGITFPENLASNAKELFTEITQ